MMNPYAGQGFLGFLFILLQRLVGQKAGPLFADEVQLLVLLFLGVALSFLGSFLLLRQMTMVANALSHTLLLGVVLAFLAGGAWFGALFSFTSFSSMGLLWIAALVMGIATVFLSELLVERFRVQEDASIALVFTSLFALGVALVTLFTRNLHLGMEALMGNLDALRVEDVSLTGIFSLVLVCCCLVTFRGFFSITFDPVFAKSIAFPVRGLRYFLMFLTAGGSIASFRAVGVLLFLSFLVGPPLIARLYTHSLKRLIMLSIGVSSLCSLVSVALSRHVLSVFSLPLSTAGILSTLLFCCYLLLLLLQRYRNKFF